MRILSTLFAMVRDSFPHYSDGIIAVALFVVMCLYDMWIALRYHRVYEKQYSDVEYQES